jgi:hypothetical protein
MSHWEIPWVPAGRLAEEINNMQVDVLSARCIADRLRLSTALVQIAAATNEEVILKLETDLRCVLEFVREVHAAKAPPDAPPPTAS